MYDAAADRHVELPERRMGGGPGAAIRPEWHRTGKLHHAVARRRLELSERNLGVVQQRRRRWPWQRHEPRHEFTDACRDTRYCSSLPAARARTRVDVSERHVDRAAYISN